MTPGTLNYGLPFLVELAAFQLLSRGTARKVQIGAISSLQNGLWAVLTGLCLQHTHTHTHTQSLGASSQTSTCCSPHPWLDLSLAFVKGGSWCRTLPILQERWQALPPGFLDAVLEKHPHPPRPVKCSSCPETFVEGEGFARQPLGGLVAIATFWCIFFFSLLVFVYWD